MDFELQSTAYMHPIGDKWTLLIRSWEELPIMQSQAWHLEKLHPGQVRIYKTYTGISLYRFCRLG